MQDLASQIRELQNLKVAKVKALKVPEAEKEASRWPIFCIKQQKSKNLVGINSSNWEFCMFMIKEREKDLEKVYQEFLEIDKKQHDIFMKIKCILQSEHAIISKVLGIELASVLICELGSIKRLAEIPSTNLKGIGYVKSCFYNQEPYVSYHPDLIDLSIAERPRKLREVCSRISKAAKFEYFAIHKSRRDDMQTILSPRHNNQAKEPTKRRASPAKKKTARRGGWTRRKRKKLHVYNKERARRIYKDSDGLSAEDSSTGASTVSTE